MTELGSYSQRVCAVSTILSRCRDLAVASIAIGMCSIGIVIAGHADFDVISTVSVPIQGLVAVL